MRKLSVIISYRGENEEVWDEIIDRVKAIQGPEDKIFVSSMEVTDLVTDQHLESIAMDSDTEAAPQQ